MVPKGSYDQLYARKVQLQSQNEELGVKLLMVEQERNQLSHNLEKIQEESCQILFSRKRSRVERGSGSSSFPEIDYKKAFKEAEKKLILKQKSIESLKVSKENMRKSFKVQIEGLEKQLNEEINQKLAVETMLKGSEIRLGKVLEENANLKKK